MDAVKIKMILLAGVLLLGILFLIIVIVRREKSKRKVRRMGMPQKLEELNGLAKPFGFFYDPGEDVFTSRLSVWQRAEGYEALFDRMAAGMNMVLDAWPVYFDYRGKTWLIEFWKGQYGINTGGEVGIYCAKGIVPPHLYHTAHYDAVSDDEMPYIRCRLEKMGDQIYELCRRHWWLTGFRMGMFSKPSSLRLMTTLTFDETEMAQAFYQGLKRSGIPENKYRCCQNEVYVRMDFSRKVTCLARIHRFPVQILNRFYCWLYRVVTCPFKDTVDRMLFLYYQLPGCFRRMLRLRRNGCKKRGKRRRCGKRKHCKKGRRCGEREHCGENEDWGER